MEGGLRPTVRISLVLKVGAGGRVRPHRRVSVLVAAVDEALPRTVRTVAVVPWQKIRVRCGLAART